MYKTTVTEVWPFPNLKTVTLTSTVHTKHL